ncbi:Solute carrier organic anion transporter family member 1B3 [Gossypium arboreum]|uniref:Solute carrier organic anion transporter family member 1B3 n=1 Tax=Gossypium arboreum TaxID=29729 RepID=A0A0B0MC71_GOSAR|nr:Solute carrier organic anion transporter family member 1B3 [Gossypium arboreum]
MVLHVNQKSMTTSQTWSYMNSHNEILCHDICILTIPRVRTGFFIRQNFIDTFSNNTIKLEYSFLTNSISYEQ